MSIQLNINTPSRKSECRITVSDYPCISTEIISNTHDLSNALKKIESVQVLQESDLCVGICSSKHELLLSISEHLSEHTSVFLIIFDGYYSCQSV